MHATIDVRFTISIDDDKIPLATLAEFVTEQNIEWCATIPTSRHRYTHSRHGRSSHSVQATLGEDTVEESHSLLNLSVDADWDETVAKVNDIDAATEDATVVGDADKGIVAAFTDQTRDDEGR